MATNTHLVLPIQRLTQDAFALYGDVIEARGRPLGINQGNTDRFDALSQVACENGGSLVFNLFRAQPRSLPMRIRMLERHPLGSQSFQPLSGLPWLVLVADAVDQPHLEHLHLFLARPDQGVNYRRNTWHHPVLALHSVSDYLVMDRKGPGNNCEEYYFNNNMEIWLPDEQTIESLQGTMP